MKTAITILFLLVLTLQAARAQTFAEWFRQKSTQKKYLIEQIAALKVYGGYLKKGYDISKKSLRTISQLKDGDFRLHEDYFNKLKQVNPEINKYPRVKDLLKLQEQIQNEVDETQKLASRSAAIRADELSYIKNVFARLRVDCLQTIAELESVITPGMLQMKDDERIARIDLLYQASQDQYAFAYFFGNSVSALVIQKKQAQKELETTRSIYGIKKN